MKLVYIEFVNPPCIVNNKHVPELCPLDRAGLKREFAEQLLSIGVIVADVAEGAHALHHVKADAEALAKLVELGYHIQEPIYELVAFTGDRPHSVSDSTKGRVAN